MNACWEYVFPILCSRTSQWLLEIDPGGSFYAIVMGNLLDWQKFRFFYNILQKSPNEQLVPHPWPPPSPVPPLKSWLLNIHQHTTWYLDTHTAPHTYTHMHTEPIVGTQQQSSSQWKTLRHRSKANRSQGQKPPGPRKRPSSVVCNSDAPLTRVPNPLCHRAWAAASLRQETSLKTTTESCEDHILWPLLPMPWLCWASWRVTTSPNF